MVDVFCYWSYVLQHPATDQQKLTLGNGQRATCIYTVTAFFEKTVTFQYKMISTAGHTDTSHIEDERKITTIGSLGADVLR